jgi:hypothetical protein
MARMARRLLTRFPQDAPNWSIIAKITPTPWFWKLPEKFLARTNNYFWFKNAAQLTFTVDRLTLRMPASAPMVHPNFVHALDARHLLMVSSRSPYKTSWRPATPTKRSIFAAQKIYA